MVGKGSEKIWIPVSVQAWVRLNGAEEFKTSKCSSSDWSLTWKLKVFKIVESLEIGLLFLDTQVQGYHMEEIRAKIHIFQWIWKGVQESINGSEKGYRDVCVFSQCNGNTWKGVLESRAWREVCENIVMAGPVWALRS